MPVEKASTPSTPPKDLPPELANYSKYRFLRELGRGGMGVVYQAEQTVMGRTVAVKVINPSVLDHPDALPRFQGEVIAAAKLDHPNIVRAYDAEQVGSMHLLVMEYVEGASLADLVVKKGLLSVAHACHYIRQAALGLQHAFEQGMVHRDIKPHNLMVNARGQVKVLDFGLARMRSERKAGGGLTQVDSFMGTPEYVSPEQATDAHSADTRADLYSLGCTLFFLLTGRPPFQGGTAVKLIMAHIERDAPALHEVRADVPVELSAVVARMLVKDPAHRFQTPLEVAQALAAFVKAGAKPAMGVASPPSGVSSPGTGTALAMDTSQIKAILRDVPGKAPAQNAPDEAEAASVFAGLGEPVTSAKQKGKRARKAAKPAAAQPSSQKKWLLGGGIGVGVLLLVLLGMWASVVRVKTPDGTPVVAALRPPMPSPDTAKQPANALRSTAAAPAVKPVRPKTDYDALATGRWIALLPSQEEFERLRSQKSYSGEEPRFDHGILETKAASGLIFPIDATNVIVRARVKKLSPKGAGGPRNVNLAIRRSPGKRHYGAWFNGGGEFGFGRADSALSPPWENFETYKFPEDYDGFFEFAFAAVGDQLTVYVNGTMILGTNGPEVHEHGGSVMVGGEGLFQNIEVQVLDPVPKSASSQSTEVKPQSNGKETTDANALNNVSWAVVCSPGKQPQAYRDALAKAERASELAPAESIILNTLGVACYRAGEYARAVGILERSLPLNEKQHGSAQPADLAFLAMAHHQLGHTDQTGKYLERLHLQTKKGQGAITDESLAFLQEAEDLIEPGNRLKRLTIDVDVTKKAYQNALGVAQRRLIAAFGAAVKQLAATKMDAKERQRQINLLEIDLRVFKLKGQLPWSWSMRTTAMAYLSELRSATGHLANARSYQLRRYRRPQESDKKVEQLLTSVEPLLSPHVLGTWSCKGLNFNGSFVWKLYSNGKINDPNGASTWSLEQSGMTLHIHTPEAPGGVWIDSCEIGVAGQYFKAKNQRNGMYEGRLVR
jgi:serine/threonine protein kinase/tetratricopeptide (TPR) repeat protein